MEIEAKRYGRSILRLSCDPGFSLGGVAINAMSPEGAEEIVI
jgi:hypothetical protein